MIIAVSILCLFSLLILGVPIPIAFLGTTLWFVVVGGYDPSFILPFGYSRMNTVIILAIPLFIIAGGLLNRSNIGNKIVNVVEMFVGKIRGGLGAIGIISCAIFGSITGSACATLSAMGTIMFPRLKDAGYPVGHSAAIMASAAVVAMTVPPSPLMILYAWVGQVSVLACFLACTMPAILLMVLLCVVNMFMVRNDQNIRVEASLSRDMYYKELGKRTKEGLPALSLPIVVLGGIYGGFVTPTEAAALSIFCVLPLGFFVYKGLTWRGVGEVMLESVIITGAIMMMLYCIMILSRFYIMEDMPNVVLDFLTSISDNKYTILLMINVFMVIIGMIMDDVSAVLLVTPILLPVVVELGVHPIHFAAVVGVNIGMGNITPPTAPVLYLSSQLSGAPVAQAIKPTLILILFAWFPTLVITTYCPELALWLPRVFLGI